MKMQEMAELLDGLAGTFERVMQKSGLSDLREVSECFRRFPDDSVGSFCKYVIQVREGKTQPTRGGKRASDEIIGELVAKIEAYRANHRDYEYAEIRQLAAEVGKLTVANLKLVASQVGCPVTGTKPQMVSRLENWLLNLKQSADRASFTLSAAGAN